MTPPFFIYPPGVGAGVVYIAPCAPPAWSLDPNPVHKGIPGEVFQHLPRSVRTVFAKEELVSRICAPCQALENLQFGGEGGKKTVSAFCGSCLVTLSRSPEFACACGKSRHIDSLAKPSGKLCSACHQAARRW